MNATRSVVWQSIGAPGLEHATLEFLGDEIALRGTIVTTFENQPLTIQYGVELDLDWRTRSATAVATLNELRGWRSVQVGTRGHERWTAMTRMGERVPVFAFNGCVDIDLGFTPATNTIALRRLGLAVGESAELTAAWVRFPDFELLRLRQRYTRLEEFAYRYESIESGFSARLTVDELGLVVRYGDFWERIASGDGFDPVAQAPKDLGDLVE